MPLPIYLDNAATTRPRPEVRQAIEQSLREGFYNPSAAYAPALMVEKNLTACRDALREVLCARAYEVVFTSGGTEADALAILGTAQHGRRKKRLLCSAVEHPAVRETCAYAAGLGHQVEEIPVDGRGLPNLEALSRLLETPADLVSVMQVCNETGAVAPLSKIAALLREKSPDARLHVDGVQGFLRLPVDLTALGITFYTVSAHKIHGPKGTGALLMRKGTPLTPLWQGGGQEMGLRSGTENTPGIAGLSAAVAALSQEQEAVAGMRSLKTLLWELLRAGIPVLLRNGPEPDSGDSAPHILNASFPGVRGEVMLHALEAEGIFVSTGAACSTRRKKENHVLKAMGRDAAAQEAALRFSLSPETTRQEIEQAARTCIAQYEVLRRFRRH